MPDPRSNDPIDATPADAAVLAERRGLARRLHGYAVILIDKVRRLAWIGAIAAVWGWGVVAYPFAFETAGAWIGALVVLAVLLVPPGLLALFVAGLDELIGLPERLSRSVQEGQRHAADMIDAARPASAPAPRRRWGLLGTLWALGRLLLESKGALIGSVALVRRFTPIVLLGVVLAAGACFVLVAGAVVATLVVVV